MSARPSGSPGPGERVTLAQIARTAGVSVPTVSLVLNRRDNTVRVSQQTRSRVLQVADQLGYRPHGAARALATGRSHTILVACFDQWDENLVERLRAVQSCLMPRGYSTRVCTVGPAGGLEAFTSIVGSRQADGVLLTGLATPQALDVLWAMRTETQRAGVPMVALADAFPAGAVDAVAHIDDYRGGYLATRHLLEHGHRRVAFIGVQGQNWSGKRETAYHDALTEAGADADPELVRHCGTHISEVRQVVDSLVDHTVFTALFASSDHIALAAMAALRAHGRSIPDDCAVVAFNDGEAAANFCEPPLTTIRNPFDASGATACDILLELIDGLTVTHAPLPVKLIVRGSCGCHKASPG